MILDDGQDRFVSLDGYFEDMTRWISICSVAKIDADLILSEIEIIKHTMARRWKARLAPKAIVKALGARLVSWRDSFLTVLRWQRVPKATAQSEPRWRKLGEERGRQAHAALTGRSPDD